MNLLENLKSDEISYFLNYDWFPNWETFLTLDCWKSWRDKIPSFQSKEELLFYTQRLGEIADLIWRSKKYGDNVDLLKEEIRLQNISQEDWKKEYKFTSSFTEMSTEEIDKNFGKDIDDLFLKEKGENVDSNETLSGSSVNQLSVKDKNYQGGDSCWSEGLMWGSALGFGFLGLVGVVVIKAIRKTKAP